MSNRKVLVAIPCLLLGGTEYQTLSLVKVLMQGGYSVTVLCYFEYNSVMVNYMKGTGADVVLMTKSGTRPKKFSNVLWALYSGFKKNLKIVKPDIVHLQYLAPGSLAILLFKFLGVKKVIATAHVPGHIYKRKWYLGYLPIILLIVSYVFPNLRKKPFSMKKHSCFQNT